MRRTIAQAALVFTSALLIMALAGCGGSSKKTAADAPDPGGMMPDPGTPAPDPPAEIEGLSVLGNTHTLTAGTEIAAGDDLEILKYSKGRGATVMCPSAAGEAGCVVSENTDGDLVATGGLTAVVSTYPIVWEANAGAHAVGLGTRITRSSSNTAYDTLTDPAVADVVVRDTRDDADEACVINTDCFEAQGSMQGTVAYAPSLDVRWTKSEPTWGLTLNTEVFSSLSGLAESEGKLSVEKDAPPALGSGWSGASLSRDFLTSGEQTGKALHAIVYTNMEKPAGYRAAGSTRQIDVLSDSSLSTNSDVTAIFGATAPTADVEISLTVASLGTNVKFTIPSEQIETLRSGETLTSIPGVTVSYTDTDGDAQTVPADRVSMRCVSDTCRGVIGTNARLTGSWDIEFTSSPATAEVAGTQDGVYQLLGAWLVLPGASGATGDTSYNLGSFAYSESDSTGTGSRMSDAQLDTGLNNDDRLNFNGKAAGLYMTGTYGGPLGNRSLRSAEFGSFTADAKLTLKGSNSGDFNGVEGSLSGFKDDNDKSLGWRMSLEDTTTGEAGTDGMWVGNTVLETPGGLTAQGAWSTQILYSNIQAGNIGSATGTFNAATDNSGVTANDAVHVVGAFSVDREASN